MFTPEQKKDRFNEDIKEIKGDANRLKSDLKSSATGTVNDLSEMAHEAGRQVRDYAGVATRQLTDATSTVTNQIQRNPIQSSVIALAVGFFLGGFFRRR